VNPKTIRSRLGLLALGVCVGLLLGEAAARIADLDGRWMPSLLSVNAADAVLLQESAQPGLIFELVPSQSLELKPIPGWGDPVRRVSTNGLGLRGPERTASKPDGVFRIVCIGGSNTYGASVTDGAPWPDALERSLLARGVEGVEVWNSGVSAWVTTQKVIRAEQALAEWEPDLLLFQLFNTGPRHIIGSDYEEIPWRPQFDREPSLWADQLRWVPDSGPGFWMTQSSALVRGVVMAANRRSRALEPEDRSWIISMEQAARARGERAYIGLRQRWPDAAMALVVVPAGGHADWWIEERDGPVLDLRALPNRPDLPGIDDIHPGREAYAWYGEELARMLTERRLVP